MTAIRPPIDVRSIAPWSAEYTHQLCLWYAFMRTALARDKYDLSAWDGTATWELVPTREENCRRWLENRRALFEPLPEYPLVVHESAAHVVADDTLEGEVIITVDYANFKRSELVESFQRVLTDLGLPAKEKTGPKSFDEPVRQNALKQPNRKFNVETLWWSLRVARLLHRHPELTDEGLAVLVGSQRRRTGASEDTVDADVKWIQRRKQEARLALEGVRIGRFPDPRYLPSGLPDPERT